ncbi:hypothetical protein [Porphyrobacter sp. YT40]|uniref:hypothetical protein n=1 Tax=Porphyrobacter sp. YT40 TaxID=2547601 RepID=UPI001141FE66|nr:hypothetical protein [Porphyrobacter sp. YT40]QDH35340.1 hypothetical protein E2E27_14045 [Porphyrobacter sp. YT40]
MIDEPPPQAPDLAAPNENDVSAAAPVIAERADGSVVIDLTRLVPPPPAEECIDEPADPLTSEIVVCAVTGPSPRLGPVIGPVDDGFGNAIPRARIKLSETAEAQANLHNTPVGGFNANGGELRLKIDF